VGLVLRPRLAVLWRAGGTGALVGAVLGRLIRWLQGEPFVWPETLWLMGVTGVLVLAVYALLPARADEQGLDAFDGLGLRHRLPWAQIVRVELRPWWAMWCAPALCLVTTEGRRRWLARDTRGLDALHALARRTAGPDHPLVRALETPLHRL
jgi:ribose/xylose/arabinose/galactoside ABC-type transport system permease subunit